MGTEDNQPIIGNFNLVHYPSHLDPVNVVSKIPAFWNEDLKISGEPQKENYVHVRAKRGQATNSHSLAERVRREKISERMRLLQELVPGCNKIAGKAVMLDEIINYVQSLQQQVEFLSMKLATMNPEMNLDVEQMLSKDILLPGLNFTCIPGSAPLHAFPQNVWDNDLQGILQKGI